jgi:hypothetical protein
MSRWPPVPRSKDALGQRPSTDVLYQCHCRSPKSPCPKTGGATQHIPQESYLDRGRRPRLRRATLVTAAVLAVGLGIVACAGRSPAGVASLSTTVTTSRLGRGSTQATGLLAYASCMRSHGVPGFPDPTGDGGIPKDEVIRAFRAVSNAQAQVASDKCAHLLPAGGSLSGQAARPVPTQDRQDYLKAAACMRAHGITNFPDPVFSGGNVNFPIPSSINSNSTQFIQARQTCQKLIPAGLPYSGSGG